MNKYLFLCFLLVGCNSRLLDPHTSDDTSSGLIPLKDQLEGETKADYDIIDLQRLDYQDREIAVFINDVVLNQYEYTLDLGHRQLWLKNIVQMHPGGSFTIFQGTPVAPKGSSYKVVAS